MASKLATFIVALPVLLLLQALLVWWLDFYAIHIDARFDSYIESGSWRSPGSRYGNAQMGVIVELFTPPLVVCFVALVSLLATHSRFKQMLATDRGKHQVGYICMAAAFVYMVLYVLVDDQPTVAGGLVAGLFFGGLVVWLIYLTHVAHIPRRSTR